MSPCIFSYDAASKQIFLRISAIPPLNISRCDCRIPKFSIRQQKKGFKPSKSDHAYSKLLFAGAEKTQTHADLNFANVLPSAFFFSSVPKLNKSCRVGTHLRPARWPRVKKIRLWGENWIIFPAARESMPPYFGGKRRKKGFFLFF